MSKRKKLQKLKSTQVILVDLNCKPNEKGNNNSTEQKNLESRLAFCRSRVDFLFKKWHE